ncbi:WD repeat-containing protein 55 [Oryza brachyantha]|uniref:WD repeat-containing protein 55 n=1 Tax=Oryza brachyantha TaxID=4533 RepID=J3MNS2_ORYBR|nr:WD repeat-containing protein 55 [Oryza brachyantha]
MEALHEEMPFDLAFHPSSPLVATSLITGELHLFRYAAESQPERLFAAKAHKESCRAVRFADSGNVILTGSADCSILASDVETGKPIARLEDAHENGINRLVCLAETTVASGDDEGCIKVWDTRERSCCNTFHCHEDYISDMTYVSDSNQILATSGDGTLSVNNLRRNKVKSQSEFSEDELLSVVVMKNGKKVVCGTPSGALLLYSWGFFKDCSDRFLGHAQSVDTMLKLDEETLISGAADGVIRLVGILPNRIIQPLAEHSEYPIEALAFSNDRNYLGSISHDKMLKLWDLQDLLNGQQSVQDDKHGEEDSDDSDDDGMDVDMDPSSSKGSRSAKTGKSQNSGGVTSDFFADL